MSSAVDTLLPLAEVRTYDIPSMWPLSIAWWLLLLAVIVIVTVIIVLLRRRYLHHRAKKEALLLLMSDAIQRDPVKMLQLVKRAYFSYFPRHSLSSLHGDALYRQLDQICPSRSEQDGFLVHRDLWQQANYSPRPLTKDQLTCCHRTCVQWIENALPPSRRNVLVLNSEANHV